ncbi:hypothetical protein CTA2_5874 [Colletotrichum tanaceti]|uniref:Uncharacterized protein n=1 Tax=Colletotrichum tanaceti TaxID=1306861 RepID=A0A4U6X6E1_9PEZI|nr:hypothetical protein CTA2_5874 [Colletotrichum tanaceti]TKW51022.1 hypothetical protein CTA1_9766 [Colletotrichum tanaceti]
MCFGCRGLGFVESSPMPEPRNDREDEEQPQLQHSDRPARQKKLVPKPKTIVHSAPSHDGIPAFVANSVPADTPDHADLAPVRPAYAYVFYDTSSGALQPGRAEDLARSIFDGTKKATAALADCRKESRPLPCLSHLFPRPGACITPRSWGLTSSSHKRAPVTPVLPTVCRQDPRGRHTASSTLIACINHYEREVSPEPPSGSG